MTGRKRPFPPVCNNDSKSTGEAPRAGLRVFARRSCARKGEALLVVKCGIPLYRRLAMNLRDSNLLDSKQLHGFH